LQRYVIQAALLPSLISGKMTETIADTTWTPIHFGAGDLVLHFWHPLGHERDNSKHEAFLRGRNQGDRSIGGSQALAQKMLTTSIAFVEALSAFLFSFYSELTNDDNKTSGTEAWSLVCGISRRTLDDIALHREQCETASGDGVPFGRATGPSRYGRVYEARVPALPFYRNDYQLPFLP
jgi:hypothetical protein